MRILRTQKRIAAALQAHADGSRATVGEGPGRPMWGILSARWAGSSMAEQLTLNQFVGGSSPPRLTSNLSTNEPVRAVRTGSLILAGPEPQGAAGPDLVGGCSGVDASWALCHWSVGM